MVREGRGVLRRGLGAQAVSWEGVPAVLLLSAGLHLTAQCRTVLRRPLLLLALGV